MSEPYPHFLSILATISFSFLCPVLLSETISGRCLWNRWSWVSICLGLDGTAMSWMFRSLKQIVARICLLPCLPRFYQSCQRKSEGDACVEDRAPCLSSWDLDGHGACHADREWLLSSLRGCLGLESLVFYALWYLWLCIFQAQNCRLCLKIWVDGSQIIIAVLHQALSVNKMIHAKSLTFSIIFNLRNIVCPRCDYPHKKPKARRGWVYFLGHSTNKWRNSIQT